MENKKLGKAPAFQFYASDFLSDINVTTMTMAQRGMYITLLAFEWIEGSLPTDLLKLRILCGNHPDFDSDWQIVMNCFIERDGRLYNNRLETERGNMIAYRERMSANGKKGAQTRWQGNGKAIAKPSNKEVEDEVVVKAKRINVKKDLESEFLNEFWELYPRRDNRKRAMDKYISIRKSGVKKESVLEGLLNYIRYWKKKGTEPQYIPMASSWLHQERFNDDFNSMFGDNIVENLKVATKIDYMCTECKHEKPQQVKNLTNEPCESCSDGRYQSKKMALLELELIERDKKARKRQPVKQPVTTAPAVQASTSTSEAGNAAAKDSSSTKLSDVFQKLGV